MPPRMIVPIRARCARATIGPAAAAQPRSAMNSRSLMGFARAEDHIGHEKKISHFGSGIVPLVHVRFGSMLFKKSAAIEDLVSDRVFIGFAGRFAS
jgi:hypothetical protein